MIPFLRKRLQVFISSTFTDLISERQAAVEAILTAGHIPAGMELFTAGDESQMQVIEQWIDESDVYLLILGGRYGSIEPKSGKSYTHLEYEYAIKRGKPFFACMINDDALEAKVKAEGSSVLETENSPALKAFRSNLTVSKMVKFWSDQKDIKIAVSETMALFSRREDLIGWIRPNAEADLPALTDELARLSKENASLRERLESSAGAVTIQGLDYREMKQFLEMKDLLGFLLENQHLFSDGSTLTSEDPHFYESLNELIRLGILDAETSFSAKFSDDGIRFMTRLEYDQKMQEWQQSQGDFYF